MSEGEQKEKKIKEFSDDSLREIAKEIVIRRTALKIHSISYIGVNIFLFIINFLTMPTYLWSLWSIGWWGIALLMHIFTYITYKKGVFTTGKGIAIGYHAFSVLIVSGMLIFTDWFCGYALNWWYWAVVPMWLSVLIHYAIYHGLKPKKGENPRKSYIDRKVDKEMEKIKNR